MTISTTNPGAAPADAPDRGNRLGWLALLPALALLVWQLAIPAGRTIRLSLSAGRVLDPLQGQVTGFSIRNYRVEPQELIASIGRGLGLGGVLLAGGLVLGPVIGMLAARTTEPVRRVIQIVLALFLVSYAPIGVLITTELRHGGTQSQVAIILLAYLPIVIAATALAHLCTQRIAASLIIGVVTVLGSLAWGLQTLDTPFFGRPRDLPAAELLYQSAFVQAQFARGAAISVLLLVILWILGIIAALVLLVPGVRIRLAERSSPGALAPGVIAAVIIGIVAVVLLVLNRHWVSALFHIGRLPHGMDKTDATKALINTWLPPLIAVPVELVVAGLAGFGIGWLRPIGRHSRWLLMIFAPWMFVGIVPLLSDRFLQAAAHRQLNTFAAQVPAIWVAVPMIFGFSLLFAAFRERPKVQPLIGGLVLAALLSLVTAAQSIKQGLVLGTTPGRMTVGVRLVVLSELYGASPDTADGLWLLLPLPILFVIAAVAVVAVLLLRQVRIELGPAR